MAIPGSVTSPTGFPTPFAFNHIVVGLEISFTDLVTIPYINPTIAAPLAVGATAHLINAETGIPTVTVPQGYTSSILEADWSQNQDVEIWYLLDGTLIAPVAIPVSGENGSISGPVTFSTIALDPVAQYPHVWDVIVINKGLDLLKGGVDFVIVMEEIGTPPLSTVKKGKCPFCGNIQSMPVETTVVVCSACKNKYILRYFPKNQALMGGR